MGSKCSKNSNKDDPENDLTDYDRTIFNLKREKVFYGTIAICVLYASFALLLFILSLLSEKVKFLLLNNFLPFTIVYIIGTVIIVLYLIAQVMEFKPYKIDKTIKYSDISCPDYWILEPVKPVGNDKDRQKTIDDQFKLAFESNAINMNVYNYRCKLNSNIFNKRDIYLTDTKDKYFYTDLTTAGIITNFDNKADSNIYNNVINANIDKEKYSIYTNIAPDSTKRGFIDDVSSNIFRDSSNVKVEFVRQALYMNNFKQIIGEETNFPTTNPSYEYYRRPVDITATPIPTAYDTLTTTLQAVRIHNFNYAPVEATPSIATPINHKEIRLTKLTGELHVNTGSGTIAWTKITNFPLVCDKMYPLLMASKDNDLHKKDPKFDNNVYRCAYSKLCGIPWSDMNCDNYADITY